MLKIWISISRWNWCYIVTQFFCHKFFFLYSAYRVAWEKVNDKSKSHRICYLFVLNINEDLWFFNQIIFFMRRKVSSELHGDCVLLCVMSFFLHSRIFDHCHCRICYVPLNAWGKSNDAQSIFLRRTYSIYQRFQAHFSFHIFTYLQFSIFNMLTQTQSLNEIRNVKKDFHWHDAMILPTSNIQYWPFGKKKTIKNHSKNSPVT